MTNLVSSITGQLAKSLLIAFVLPTTLFVCVIRALLMPQIFANESFPNSILNSTGDWEAVALTLITIALSALLHALNIPIIRLFEGYPWAESLLGHLLTQHFRKKYDYLHARWNGMRTLLRSLNRNHTSYERIQEFWLDAGRQLKREFPRSKHLVLPTRLGNVIRSFENYPFEQYQMSAITLWPRLIAKIDTKYAAVLDDGKARVDFMINGSFLSLSAGLLFLGAGIAFPARLILTNGIISWLITIIISLLFARCFYVGSISSASAWGDHVKSSFDLYRWELLDQMGYKDRPRRLSDEREVWGNISQRMIYGDTPRLRTPQYASLLTFARGNPPNAEIDVQKGALRYSATGRIMVRIRPRITDKSVSVIQNVKLVETLPEGFLYEWNSATFRGKEICTTGTNPLIFEIGELRADTNNDVLEFCLIPIVAK